MVTWIEEGEFYGHPKKAGPVEITCGTRHEWKLGVSPDVVSKSRSLGLPLPKKEIWDQVKAYESQLMIELKAYDTSGFGQNYQFTSVSNSMVATITHFDSNGKVLEGAQQHTISNQYPTQISLNGKGKYRVVLKSKEAGEGCIIPKGKKTIYFTISKETETEPVYQPQATTPTEIETPPISAPIVVLVATGVMLMISSFFKKKPKDEIKSLDAEERIKKVGLVKGRHKMPATEFVYGEIVLDENFKDTILEGLPAQSRHWMNRNLPGTDKLELYITGFAPALTAFLIEWNKAQPECELILMHYNAQNGEYVKQLYEIGEEF